MNKRIKKKKRTLRYDFKEYMDLEFSIVLYNNSLSKIRFGLLNRSMKKKIFVRNNNIENNERYEDYIAFRRIQK